MNGIAVFISLLPAIAGVPALEAPAEDPPEIVVGEALFLETRFAEFFAAHSNDVNQPLTHGDPALDFTATANGNLPGPFRGKSMNCRACHLVDEFAETPDQAGAAQGGMRTYADFAPRSPIPDRGDGKKTTLRNTPSQVNASVDRAFPFFHFDAEFSTMEELVRESFLGRNFGWLKDEREKAMAHIAHVIREDHGAHPLAEDDAALARFSYADILRGTDPALPPEIALPEAYRVDVATASDAQVMEAIAKLVAIYVTDLAFSHDDEGYNLSPYDCFLRKNHLPLTPDEDESPLQYSRHLLADLDALRDPAYVTEADGHFLHHDQIFQFGEIALDGLKIFLRTTAAPGQDAMHNGGVGNCVACHAAPHFTDYRFHNTGTAQEEYDAVHGDGAFAQITIPECTARSARDIPATGDGPFADIPSLEHPGHTDLGLWNVFQNPAFPTPQDRLMQLLQQEHPGVSDPNALLAFTVATFKTPGLRDLGHSNPYFHTGRFGDLEGAVRFYRNIAELARHDGVRNADPELFGVHLVADDVPKLVAFLKALNEDYE